MVEAWMIAAATLFPVITLKFLLGSLMKGTFGLILKAAIGIGAAIGAAAVASFCPGLGLFLAVLAIIFGEFFGALGVFLGPKIPWIGASIGQAIAPISGVLWWILILNIVLFILHLLAIFDIIPIIGTIMFIATLVIPIIILWLIWGSYVDAMSGVMSCFGGGPAELPGTGGIKIGT
ncbi:MAG: hypothetical protein J7K73_01185 [Nanoarchaeota archaeon]|nr:hypothetical protein [Nanoarchaeota archaeon]